MTSKDFQSILTSNGMEKRASVFKLEKNFSSMIKEGNKSFTNIRWEDEKGCYYDENGEPSGWFVKCEDEKEHFFDIDGNYVPTDDEDDYELNSWEATQQKPA